MVLAGDLSAAQLLDNAEKKLKAKMGAADGGTPEAAVTPVKAMVGEVIREDEIWSCTTCRDW